MKEKIIKNVIDYKYNEFEIGDKIEFGKWNKDYGYRNKSIIWTILKKVDFSNLSEDDNKFLEAINVINTNKYDGKALIITMHDITKIHQGIDFFKDEKLPHGGYLNFYYYNEWFDKYNFPIVLNENENEILLEDQNDAFHNFDGDFKWKGCSDYLGKDLLFEDYDDRKILLYYIGQGDYDYTDLESWGIDISNTTKDGLFKYSDDDLYFKTNSILYSEKKCGCFKEVERYNLQTKITTYYTEWEDPFMEEYTAFDRLYWWDRKKILELLKDCKEDEKDFFCDKGFYNIIKLLIIKVKE